MRVGDKVWFTDPGDDLSSGLYTIDWIGGEVYSLSNCLVQITCQSVRFFYLT